MSETIIIDGNAIAASIADTIKKTVVKIGAKPRVTLVSVGSNEVTKSYVKRKRDFADRVGIDFLEDELLVDATQAEVIEAVERANKSSNGVIVQLPLPKHIDSEVVLRTISVDRDIDVLHPDGSKHGLYGPVAQSVLHIIRMYQLDVGSADCVVIGNGPLVGKPVRQILEQYGAKVTTLTKETPSAEFEMALINAQLVVSGVGKAGLVQPDHVAQGVVLIDAGTSNSDGQLQGDIAPECREKAVLFSPTPGGIGPITVAKLFENLMVLVASSQ